MQSTRHSPDLVEGPDSDLGPLAWVFDELRKSLEAANKALKRFSTETAAARGADLSAVDPAALRVARSQLHQVVGALDMVGFHAPALVVGAMEADPPAAMKKAESLDIKTPGEFGVQILATHIERIVHGPQCVLQNLVGLDAGNFVKKPTATRVHQYSKTLAFEQPEHHHFLQMSEYSSGMFF